MCQSIIFFFFNDTATTEIYTLSLHDALPILGAAALQGDRARARGAAEGDRHDAGDAAAGAGDAARSEEHTSELQSLAYLVCRLLLEKKKNKKHTVDRDMTRPHKDSANNSNQY